jgi:putative oxidoreductase
MEDMMKINVTRVVQIVFGFILILFGANGFLSFLPIPEKQGFAFEFLHILRQAKYMFPIIAAIMSTSGILLLSNRRINLALLIQLPISFNILVFHLFHDWQGLIAADIIFAMNMFLIVRRFDQFKLIFSK